MSGQHYPQSGQMFQQSSVQRPAIVVYPNRGQIIWRSVLVGILSLFLLIFPIMIFAFIIISGSGTKNFILLFIPLIIAFGILLPVLALLGWMIWGMLSLVFPTPKPVLVINSEGITVGSMPLASGFFIAWNEIEAIFPSSLMYKYLCILPRNPDQYLKRFNVLERLSRRLNWMIGSPLYFPQVLMAQKVDEVMQQLTSMYWAELSHHRIRLQQYQ